MRRAEKPPGENTRPIPRPRGHPGADWTDPEGPTRSIKGKDDHPVVHVSWHDAVAYAARAGKRLPTEAMWERAARGGPERRPFVRGDVPPSDGSTFANIWHDHSLEDITARDGFVRKAPVGSFPANGFGFHEMSGNVREWCADWYQRDLYAERASRGMIRDPDGPNRSSDPNRPFIPLRVRRGGSILCNDSYGSRHRPVRGSRVFPTPACRMSVFVA